MATPRTGKPRGRPPKPPAPDPRPKRERGRPPLPLSRHPDRYFYALVSAFLEGRPPGVSELRVLESSVGALRGVPVHEMEFKNQLGERIGWGKVLASARDARDSRNSKATPQQLKKLATIERRGPDGLVGLYKWGLGQPGSESRNINAFRPFVDNCRHKLKIIGKKPPTDADWMWLDRMTAAWRICLRGEIELAKAAEGAAWLVGEREYFETDMVPVLAERAAQRQKGIKVAEYPPEYFVNLIRQTVREK